MDHVQQAHRLRALAFNNRQRDVVRVSREAQFLVHLYVLDDLNSIEEGGSE